MIIATAPGGDYDLRARLVARHIGRHIPGNPAIVPRNMPGGVGIQAANYMANVAPQDGTSLHAIMQNMSTPSGARRRRRRVRHPQVLLDRQHHRYAEHDHLVAYHRHQDDPGRHGARARHRRARHGDGVGLLSEVAERDGRHQVQDRDRLSRRQSGQPGDGARRGRRPHQFVGVVEGDQAGLADGRRRSSCWCRSRSSAIRSWPTCRPRSSSPRPTRTRR